MRSSPYSVMQTHMSDLSCITCQDIRTSSPSVMLHDQLNQSSRFDIRTKRKEHEAATQQHQLARLFALISSDNDLLYSHMGPKGLCMRELAGLSQRTSPLVSFKSDTKHLAGCLQYCLHWQWDISSDNTF